MDNGFSNETLLDVFIYETTHNIEQLEKTIMSSEKANYFTDATVNEIFRIMHTIKGSAAMMMFNNIALLAHALEDLFYCIREEKPDEMDYMLLSDLVLEGVDFIKLELEKVQNSEKVDGDPANLIEHLKAFLASIKAESRAERTEKPAATANEAAAAPSVGQQGAASSEQAVNLQGYEAVIYFEEGCEMENIRAYAIVHNLKDSAEQFSYIPGDIIENSDSASVIRDKGFKLIFKSEKSLRELHELLTSTAYVRELVLNELEMAEEGEAVSACREAETAEVSSLEASEAEAAAAAQPAVAKEEAASKEAGGQAQQSSQTEQIQQAQQASQSEQAQQTPHASQSEQVRQVQQALQSEQVQQTPQAKQVAEGKAAAQVQAENRVMHQSIISVDVMKLDKLMDLMGEMVIAEAMVTQNPEIKALQLSSFHKAARQLRKITSEMQDMIMSIRMVPLSATFHKMQRIVRDMGRKLGKEVELTLIGERTEVDKNIIEHISDPLMHLVRNAVDHGIEAADVRAAGGKPKAGQIVLEAKNAGSDVIVTIKDDGKGLDKQKILQKAKKQGLLHKPESEMIDKEIFNLIFLPGFSTNENVTEFSGRGVGMDVVTKNLEAVGGSVSVDSIAGAGTITTLKIPLTLAIIDGMNVRVGNAKYTLPTTSILETFQAKERDIITELNGNEMIMVRGECYPILRIHERYAVKTQVTDLTKGIMLMVEQDDKCLCLFADELLGQQQVVVKTLPDYIKNMKRIEGLTGCTLLGDGSISLILNIGGLLNITA